MKNSESAGQSHRGGVYYSLHDYAGLRKRFAIIAVDMTCLILGSFLTSGILSVSHIIPYDIEDIALSNKYTFIVLSYFYLAVLKRTKYGTLGYWLTGFRVVNLYGERPSLWQMTFRYILLIFGPFHIVVDFFWLGGDENRQTLRDKLAATYVIRTYAQPLGHGEVAVVAYYILGLRLLFREVRRHQYA